MDFATSIIRWYEQNKRDLPWRYTRNPYLIWLSEIMLQQTRVAQGLPYYKAFTEAFPTVFDLAQAHEEQVLKLWQGLGYYSRARNLHQTAKEVAFQFDGRFPSTYKELIQLKGIGEYTAAAIASFSFDEPVPVVDGNVFRVLSRYFGIETDISSAGAKKEFAALAKELMSKHQAAIFNQSIMEFGALQCVPKSPDCSICPLSSSCFAIQKNKVNLLPVKSKKTKIIHRYFNYVVFLDQQHHTMVNKRVEKGIWHNLYEFPLIETETEIGLDDFVELLRANNWVENPIISVAEAHTKSIIHKLTHRHLHIKFIKVKVEGKLPEATDYGSLLELPFPIVIFNFIKNDWM
ncbi:A/G-specific adenine glycosylase [Flavobacterium sp. CYK-4]|uniref:A/G-specific adenine glycosylase n=1 Tax=Flavobacterium lotistagni TaxID=2709660 RepID=UPI00140DED2A|nr:A/G-specific adenine glycosylase [Flavobacterium lotistagni]NHM05926.1 A/G-specific adenine glycosylase [Flavobacterium lotistagni]